MPCTILLSKTPEAHDAASPAILLGALGALIPLVLRTLKEYCTHLSPKHAHTQVLDTHTHTAYSESHNFMFWPSRKVLRAPEEGR